jgi:hypothetical protein
MIPSDEWTITHHKTADLAMQAAELTVLEVAQ